MYLVTTPPSPSRLRTLQRSAQQLTQRLSQRLNTTPEAELERLLASAGSVGELDCLERNWAQAHRRRFG